MRTAVNLPEEEKALLLENACKKTDPSLKAYCLKKGTGLKKCAVCCMDKKTAETAK